MFILVVQYHPFNAMMNSIIVVSSFLAGCWVVAHFNWLDEMISWLDARLLCQSQSMLNISHLDCFYSHRNSLRAWNQRGVCGILGEN